LAWGLSFVRVPCKDRWGSDSTAAGVKESLRGDFQIALPERPVKRKI
jgi:hypothetical protein